MMPLNVAPVGQVLKLTSIHGGESIHHRLNALGLTPGVEIVIVSRNEGGPVILAVKDSRLALGRELQHHIQVELQAEYHYEQQMKHGWSHHRRGRRRAGFKGNHRESL
ncbi:MAG TPA: hypothetical protein DCK95_11645 [Anaerolineaceae bacterium]|nr:hypothetical protein [Anaerolineaceae bacterium]